MRFRSGKLILVKECLLLVFVFFSSFSAVFVLFVYLESILDFCISFLFSFFFFCILWFVKGYLRSILHMQVGMLPQRSRGRSGNISGQRTWHDDRAEEQVKLNTSAVKPLVRCGKKKRSHYVFWPLLVSVYFTECPLLLSLPPVLTLDPDIVDNKLPYKLRLLCCRNTEMTEMYIFVLIFQNCSFTTWFWMWEWLDQLPERNVIIKMSQIIEYDRIFSACDDFNGSHLRATKCHFLENDSCLLFLIPGLFDTDALYYRPAATQSVSVCRSGD